MDQWFKQLAKRVLFFSYHVPSGGCGGGGGCGGRGGGKYAGPPPRPPVPFGIRPGGYSGIPRPPQIPLGIGGGSAYFQQPGAYAGRPSYGAFPFFFPEIVLQIENEIWETERLINLFYGKKFKRSLFKIAVLISLNISNYLKIYQIKSKQRE